MISNGILANWADVRYRSFPDRSRSPAAARSPSIAGELFCSMRHFAISMRSCPKKGSPSNTSVGTPQWPAISSATVGGDFLIERFGVAAFRLGIEFGEIICAPLRPPDGRRGASPARRPR